MLLIISLLKCTEINISSDEKDLESLLGFTHEDIDSVLSNGEDIETILGINKEKIPGEKLKNIMNTDNTHEESHQIEYIQNYNCVSTKNIPFRDLFDEDLDVAKNRQFECKSEAKNAVNEDLTYYGNFNERNYQFDSGIENHVTNNNFTCDKINKAYYYNNKKFDINLSNVKNTVVNTSENFHEKKSNAGCVVGGKSITNKYKTQKNILHEENPGYNCGIISYKKKKTSSETHNKKDNNLCSAVINHSKTHEQLSTQEPMYRESHDIERTTITTDERPMFSSHEREKSQDNQNAFCDDSIYEQIQKKRYRNITYVRSKYNNNSDLSCGENLKDVNLHTDRVFIQSQRIYEQEAHEDTFLDRKYPIIYDTSGNYNAKEGLIDDDTFQEKNNAIINDISSTTIANGESISIDRASKRIQNETNNKLTFPAINNGLLLDKRLKDLKITLETLRDEEALFISRIPNYRKKLTLNKQEMKTIKINRNYLKSKFEFYEKNLITYAYSIKDKVSCLESQHNELIINSLNFVISVCNFVIPPNRLLGVCKEYYKLFFYFSLDYWKIETALNKINLSDFTRIIYYNLNNKTICENEKKIEILYDLLSLVYKFEDFYKQKESLSKRIKNICEVMSRKHNYKLKNIKKNKRCI
ncbi:uncharacterized protein VNE69_02250 [Vairimorpha necatrix]|uniref:Uncharacterized protein n=1 Tax=Vairimorpha necatrix TaxID=6039 RepID=A0AAX4J9Z0_9MICR